MGICTTDPERIDTDPLTPVCRPRHWLYGDFEHRFLEWNWRTLVYVPVNCIINEVLLSGLGVTKCAFGGITFLLRARAALMMLVSPDAPSEWPTFGFI